MPQEKQIRGLITLWILERCSLDTVPVQAGCFGTRMSITGNGQKKKRESKNTWATYSELEELPYEDI